MKHSHLNIQPQFLQNNHNHIECSLIPSPLHQEQQLFQSFEGQNYTQNLFNDLGSSKNKSLNAPDKFYQQYKRIYQVCFKLQMEKQRLKHFAIQLEERILKIEENKMFQFRTKQIENKTLSKIKNKEVVQQIKSKSARRIAQQTHKQYKCNEVCCRRVYVSESSLHQHIKIKHPEQIYKEQKEGESSQLRKEQMQLLSK